MSVLEDLNSARSKLARLAEERAEKLAELREQVAFRKRDEYLRQITVSHFDRFQLTPNEIGALTRNGVHNAADVMNASATLYRFVSERLAKGAGRMEPAARQYVRCLKRHVGCTRCRRCGRRPARGTAGAVGTTVRGPRRARSQQRVYRGGAQTAAGVTRYRAD